MTTLVAEIGLTHACPDGGPCAHCTPERYLFARLIENPGLMLIQLSTGRTVRAVVPLDVQAIPMSWMATGRSCASAVRVAAGAEGWLAPLCDLAIDSVPAELSVAYAGPRAASADR